MAHLVPRGKKMAYLLPIKGIDESIEASFLQMSNRRRNE